jgi:crotonobetainyl-CoA:carnitine CoA-transferase CaiB-like acyl-CoA transferase
VLDLKSDDGRARLLDLLAASDVFLANWRAGGADALGLTDDVLAAANPRLVRCFVTGFGPDGPSAGEPAFDTVVQGRSGLTDAINRPGANPQLIPGYPVDKLVAIMAAQAILASLFERERTGRGDRIEVSMLDVASYLNFSDLFTNRVFLDHQPDVPQNLQTSSVRPVRTRDGWVVCAPVTSPQIAAACAAVGHPEWTDEVLAQPDQPTLVTFLFDRLEQATVEFDADDLVARFLAHEVPAARCLTMDEHLVDPQVEHAEVYRVGHWDGIGPVRTVRYPAVFANWGHLAAPGVAPILGEG